MKRFEWLVKLAKKEGFKNGCQVGTGKGNTTRHIMGNLPGLKLTDIAWYPNDGTGMDDDKQKQLYSRRVRPFFRRLNIVQMPSAQASTCFPDGIFDFVFIDANHSYESCLEDIQSWLPKVKPGGIICGHDYKHPRFPGVKQAVEEMFKEEDIIDESNNDYVWAYKVPELPSEIEEVEEGSDDT